MNSVIRKISIGSDYKNDAMHYAKGQEVYGGHIINDIIFILISSIIIKKKFKIKNFGTFLLIKKNKRIGRNPKNKLEYEISKRNILSFKVSENFKKRLNK